MKSGFLPNVKKTKIPDIFLINFSCSPIFLALKFVKWAIFVYSIFLPEKKTFFVQFVLFISMKFALYLPSYSEHDAWRIETSNNLISCFIIFILKQLVHIISRSLIYQKFEVIFPWYFCSKLNSPIFPDLAETLNNVKSIQHNITKENQNKFLL